MDKTENPAASERRILKKFLQRYYRTRKQREILQARLQTMRQEFRDGAEKSSEIEAKIEAQKKEAQNSTLLIMEILDFLPQGSTERTIMEMRHIDCKTWTQVQRAVFLTASPCYERYNKGLDALLGNARVRSIIGLPQKDIGG